MNETSGSFEVTEKDWEKMSTDTKLWLIYNTYTAHKRDCDVRFCKIERRKYIHGTITAVCGMIGGAIAYLSFGKFKF